MDPEIPVPSLRVEIVDKGEVDGFTFWGSSRTKVPQVCTAVRVEFLFQAIIFADSQLPQWFSFQQYYSRSHSVASKTVGQKKC